MASTIQLKRGSGAPTGGDLAAGELGLDLTNKTIYSSTNGSDVVLMGINPASATFTGTVKFDGYSPTVNYDFNNDGSVASADSLAYTKFEAGIATGIDISSVSTIEPSWSALSGSLYSNNKFRIMSVRGNQVDASRTASALTPYGYGDATVVGNVDVNGTNTLLVTGISIGSNYVNLIGGSVRTACNFLPYTDDTHDIGAGSLRFDDIYATNGTIQTSDANEKQDIDTLSVAEQLVAARCKNLVRKFKWKSSVAEKGSEARTHFGVIAQDVKAAFEAEGLNASDYGLFIESTWTDDDGVEHTRLGVRYTELFAFIIAAL